MHSEALSAWKRSSGFSWWSGFCQNADAVSCIFAQNDIRDEPATPSPPIFRIQPCRPVQMRWNPLYPGKSIPASAFDVPGKYFGDAIEI
jgi:hypothetical protein